MLAHLVFLTWVAENVGDEFGLAVARAVKGFVQRLGRLGAFQLAQHIVETQQQLEGVFDSAFLAAVKEFSLQNRSDLAQIAAQIACVEAEHRALGRSIGGYVPADNWVFTPVLLAKVGDAPALVKSAGYLNPRSGNSFAYVEANINDKDVVYRTPFSVGCN